MKYELESCEECGSKNVEMQIEGCERFVVCFGCGNSSGRHENEIDAALDWNGGFAAGYIEPHPGYAEGGRKP